MCSDSKFKTFFPGSWVRLALAGLALLAALGCLALLGLRIKRGPAWPPPDGPGKISASAGSLSRPGDTGLFGSPTARIRREAKHLARRPHRLILVTAASFALACLFWRAGRNTRRDWFVLFGRVLLLGLSVALSAAAAEIGLRVLFYQKQKANNLDQLAKFQRGEPVKVRGSHPLCSIITMTVNSNLIYELQSNMDTDFGHRRVRTNRQGMRDSRDYPLQPAPRSVRIVGVGDSGMFGWNLEQDQDYLSVLESNLNARADGATYDVLNMGVPGYNSAQEIEMLASKGLLYRPDIAIVGWAVNDFDLPFCVTQQGNFLRKDVSFLHLLLFDRPKLRDACFVGVSDTRKGGGYDPNRIPGNLIELSGPAGVKYSLDRAKRLAGEKNFHLLVFGPLTTPILDICKELGIEYCNTYEHIPKDRYPAEYAVHSFHPRAEGHRVLAEHLEACLRERGWLTARETGP